MINKNTPWLLLIAVLILPQISFVGVAKAATVYKCMVDGVKTYSQKPCGKEYDEVYVSPTPPISSQTASDKSVKEKCLEYIKSNNSFLDPPSTRIESSKREYLTDKSGVRTVLILGINTKNANGGYSGAKPYRCFITPDGSRINKIQHLIE